MTKFESYVSYSQVREYLVSIEESMYLEDAVRYYRDYCAGCPDPNEELLAVLDRFLAYLDDNPRFILSDYYFRLTQNI